MIEPSLILGKVQTTIVWWVAVAAIDVIALRQLNSKKPDHNAS